MSLVKIHNGLHVSITNDTELEAIQNMCFEYLESLSSDASRDEEINIKLHLLLDLIELYQRTYKDFTPIYN